MGPYVQFYCDFDHILMFYVVLVHPDMSNVHSNTSIVLLKITTGLPRAVDLQIL